VRRWQDVGLVLLALSTAMLVWVAFRALDVAPVAAPRLTADLGAGIPDQAAASPEVDLEAGTQASVTESPTAPDPLQQARSVLQREERTVLLVLGDSTGNDRGEWTYRWAEALATSRPTSIAPWNEWTEDGYVQAEALSGNGAAQAGLGEVFVLSGSQTGARAGYAASRMELMAPETPDLVILNLGHNNGAEDVAGELQETLDSLRTLAGDEVPVLVTLQQPQAGDENAEVRAAVARWAQQEGLPTIDVAERFLAEEDPDALLTDALHPNDEGSALWAEVVADALDAP
jgi:lysophospholipase L1-like esterase